MVTDRSQIYSLDYDKQYIEEEEALRQAQGYVDDVMLLPPRQPGQSLISILSGSQKTAEAREEELVNFPRLFT